MASFEALAASARTRSNVCASHGTNRALGFFSSSLACTPCFLPFMLEVLSYDWPRQSIKSIWRSFNLFRITDDRFLPVVSSTTKNPRKYYFISGSGWSSTMRITIDICSWWLMSGVQSRMIEKYFAVWIFATISLVSWLLMRFSSSFCMPSFFMSFWMYGPFPDINVKHWAATTERPADHLDCPGLELSSTPSASASDFILVRFRFLCNWCIL